MLPVPADTCPLCLFVHIDTQQFSHFLQLSHWEPPSYPPCFRHPQQGYFSHLPQHTLLLFPMLNAVTVPEHLAFAGRVYALNGFAGL